MIGKTWNRLSNHNRGLVLAAGIGFVVGAIFGDLVFVVVELAVGAPLDDLILGIAGAAFASVCYELATLGRPRR